MPREGYAAISVGEVTRDALRQIVDDEDTPYNSYDDLLREVCRTHGSRVDDDLMRKVKNGAMVNKNPLEDA